MPRTRAALAAVLTLGCLAPLATAPPAAAASQASLTARLSPERLGGRTTVSFGIELHVPAGQFPAPMTGIEVRYPKNLGIGTSGLGFQTCDPDQLRAEGPSACPANSVMGFGNALVEVPFGPEVIRESTKITLYSGPVQDGHLGLLFYAQGTPPIAAQLLFPGLVLPDKAPFGGNFSIVTPGIGSVPEGPDVSIITLSSTLGPEHVTYYERRRGKQVAYTPKGILLPPTCPRGGFPFSVHLSFQDGSHSSGDTFVPCPHR